MLASVFLRQGEGRHKLQSSCLKEKQHKKEYSRQIFSKCMCNETVPAQGIFSKSRQCAAWSFPQRFLQKQCEEACLDFSEGLGNGDDLLKSSSNNFQHNWKLFQWSSSLLLTTSQKLKKGSPNVIKDIKKPSRVHIIQSLEEKNVKRNNPLFSDYTAHYDSNSKIIA